MALQDTIFLGLVFCLGQRIQAQEKLPVPTISAAPSSVIPWNASVKILCQGTPESFQYQLSIMENSTLKVVETKLGFQKEAEFLINHMNATTAGCYQCRYRKRYSWSEHSKILELVVTGFYDKPVLSTDQSLELRPGENISFRCHSAHIPFDRFSLAKEEGGSPPQQERGGYHSMFNLGPVSPKSTGSYRCYGWYDSSPYVWSSPSDALELTVADSKKQDYRTENSIRLTMAGLVLVALLIILAENWHSQEPSPRKTGTTWLHSTGTNKSVRPSGCREAPEAPAGDASCKGEEPLNGLDPRADCYPVNVNCCIHTHVLHCLVPTWWHCVRGHMEPSRYCLFVGH